MKRNSLIALIFSILGCICLIGFISFYIKQTVPFQREYSSHVQHLLTKHAFLVREYSRALSQDSSDSQSIETEALKNIQHLSKSLVPNAIYGEIDADKTTNLFKNYVEITFRLVQEAATNKQFDVENAGVEIEDATTKLTDFLRSINPHFEIKNINGYLRGLASLLVQTSQASLSKNEANVLKFSDMSLLLPLGSSNLLAEGFIHHKAKIIPYWPFLSMAKLEE